MRLLHTRNNAYYVSQLELETVETRTLPDTDRMDQFDLWPADVPAHALFVREDRGNAPLQSDRFFPQHSAPNLVVAFAPTEDPTQDEPIKSWQVYEVWK